MFRGKFSKRIGLFLLAVAVLLASAVTYAATDNYMKVDEYRDGDVYEAPEKAGYVFAGWYTDPGFETPLDYGQTTGYAYAKFVDPNVFTVKFQFRKGTDSMSADTDLRMITTVDSEHYYSIRFEMERNGIPGKQPLWAEAIYETIYGFEAGVDTPYEPTVFSADSQYFAVQKLTGLPGSVFADDFKVTPVYETVDGTVIRGTARTIQIKENAKLAEGTITDLDVADNNLRFKMEANTFPYPEGVDIGIAYETATQNAAYQIQAISGGVYIDGSTTPSNVKIAKFGAGSYVIHWARNSASQPVEGTVVKIDGVFGNDTHSIQLGPVSFVYNATSADWIMWNDEVDVLSYADDNSYPYNELRMLATPKDVLADGYYTMRYGNVWLDGEVLSCQVLRHSVANGYYVQGNWLKNVKEGSKLVIDGIVGTNTYSVKINRQTFVYDGVEWLTEGKEWYIAKDGVSEYVIVKSANAKPAETTAANELQEYLKTISGVTLPIVTDTATVAKKEIIIGKTTREAEGQFDRMKLGEDGYVIAFSDSKLWIVGGDVDSDGDGVVDGKCRGTLYGVYAYLENYLDCRFYATNIEKVPEQETIAISSFKDEYIPTFEFRDVYYAEYLGADISAKRNYNSTLWGRSLPTSIGGGFSSYQGMGGHTFYSLVSPAEYAAEHPEWFSKDANGNYAQLCLSNRDVITLIKEGALKWANDCDARGLNETLIPISQNDIQSPCLCDDCVAIYKEEGGAYSGTIIRLVNEVAEYLAENGHADKKVMTYAYQYSRSAPITKPHKNVIVELCIIEGCFSHGHEADCAMVANQSYVDTTYGTKNGSNSFEEDLAAWTAICDNLYIFDYTYNVWHTGMYFPDLQTYRSNIQLYAKYGAEGVMYEGVTVSKSPEFAELRCYLLSKLMADPYMTEEEYYAHMDDFLEGVYGEGGKYIRQYIDIATAQVKNTHVDLTPLPDTLYPTTVVQKHATTEFPDTLTSRMIHDYTNVDWSQYWNWCTDVTENPVTAEGETLFKKAMEVADEEQKERIDEIYSQVQYVQSYYYKKKIEQGQDTFTAMIKAYITAHPDDFSDQTIALADSVTDYALSQLYSEYMAFNKALAQKYVSNGYDNYRPAYSMRYWQNFDFSRVPMNWSRASVSTNLDTVDTVDAHLWIRTGSADTLTSDTQWSRKYWASTGGIYVDDKLVKIPLIKLYSNQYIIRLPILDQGGSIPYGTRVTVDGVFGAVSTGKTTTTTYQYEDKHTGLKFNATTFVYMETSSGNGKWIEAPHVTVTDDTMQDTCLRFSVSAEDTLAYASDYVNQSSYSAIYGGIWINDKLRNDVKLSKYASGKYIIYWPVYGVTPTEGMTVKIDGIFGTSAGLVRIDESFIYDGNSNWYQNIKVGLNGRTDTAFWLYTGVTDALPYSSSQSEKYSIKMGSITVDGVEKDAKFIKVFKDVYIVDIRGKDGMTVTFDCVIGNDTNSYWIGPITFVFDADLGSVGTWVQVVEEEPADTRNPITSNEGEAVPDDGYSWGGVF